MLQNLFIFAFFQLAASITLAFPLPNTPVEAQSSAADKQLTRATSSFIEVASTLNSCLLRIIDLSGSFKSVHQIKHPLTISTYPAWCSSTNIRDQYAFKTALTSELKTRNENRQAINLRSLNCVLTFLNVPCRNYSKLGFSEAQSAAMLMQQSSVLPYAAKTAWIFQEYVIVNAQASSAISVSDSLFYGWERLPTFPVFVFTENATFFACWYCINQTENIPIESPSTSCSRHMINEYQIATGNGSKLSWTAFPSPPASDANMMTPVNIQIFLVCPFTLQQNVSCSRAEQDLVVDALFGNKNDTLYVPPVGRRRGYTSMVVPSIQRGTGISAATSKWFPASFTATGYSSELKFITADGVTDRLSPWWALTNPFESNVWAALAFVVILLALILTRVNEQGLIGNTLELISSMLGQGPSQLRLRNRLIRSAFSTFTTVWMLFSVIISNSYNGIMQSNYMREYDLASNWTDLWSLDNFSLSFGYLPRGRWSSCDQMNEKLKGFSEYTGDGGLTRESFFWYMECWGTAGNEERNECTLSYEIQQFDAWANVAGHSNYKKWREDYISRVTQMTRHFKLVCMDDLYEFIGSELVKPRTAFVLPIEHFNEDWKQFEKFMSDSQGAVKFAHNLEQKDGIFRRVVGYSVSDVQNQFVKNQMAVKVKALVSSGLIGLWDEWERLRKLQWGRKNGDGPKVLSMDNSDIHIIFRLFIICLGMAALEFAWEIVGSKINLCVTCKAR